MPTIPDPSRSDRRLPTPSTIVSGTNAVPDSSGIGKGFAEIGSLFKGYADKRKKAEDEFQLTNARTAWLMARTDAEAAMEGDTDYETMEERFRESLYSKMGESNALIQDERVRALFEQEQLQDIENHAAVVNRHAFSVKSSQMRAILRRNLDDLAKTGIEASTQDAMKALELMNDSIVTAVNAGYVGADEGEALRQASSKAYALSSIEQAPPSEGLKLLRGPLGKILSLDVRNRVTEELKEDLAEQEAILTVDLWLADGHTPKTIEPEFKKIKDKDLRKAIETRFRDQYSIRMMANESASFNLYQELSDQIEAGEITSDDITRDQKRTLSAAHLNALKSQYVTKAAGRNVVTDPNARHRLNVLIAQERWSKASSFLRDGAGTLFSREDVKLYDDKIVTAMHTGAQDSFLTAKQRLETEAGERNIKTDTKNYKTLLKRFDDWWRGYMDLNEGREPPYKETTEAIKSLFENKPVKMAFDRPLYQHETAAVELLLRGEEHQQDTDYIARVFKKATGKDITPDQLLNYTINRKRIYRTLADEDPKDITAAKTQFKAEHGREPLAHELLTTFIEMENAGRF